MTSLIKLKNWNYKKIYFSEDACKNESLIREYFYKIFKLYLDYLNEDNKDNTNSKRKILEFVNDRSSDYKKNTNKKRMVIDYIAGQTDSYFLRECEENFKEFKREELYK